MTIDISVANQALDEVGSKTLISDPEEQSTQAKLVKRHFEATRDELLAKAWWNFARASATLSLRKALPGTPENPTSGASSVWSSAYPAPPWLYEYAYPSDCIRARYIEPQLTNVYSGTPIFPIQNSYAPVLVNGAAVPFVVSSGLNDENQTVKSILTNQSQAILTYTKRVEVPAQWSPPFRQGFIKALAAKMAMPLTGNVRLVAALLQAANTEIAMAQAADGNEGLSVQTVVPDWLRARGYSETLDGLYTGV